MVKPGTDELRQNVFSSTHMSTMVKTAQATIEYPCCSYCGGNLKSSAKRKVVFGQLSLYTNTSEAFIVWYKKHDEPKGILWLRSYSIKKSHHREHVELATRSCRKKCSYKLSFMASSVADEWYRVLKQESRRAPSLGEGIFHEELDSASSLDSILNEATPTYIDIYSDSDDSYSDDMDRFERQSAMVKGGTFNPSASVSRGKIKRVEVKSTPLIGGSGSPISEGLWGASPILATPVSACAPTTMDMLHLAPESLSEDHLSRWSWPLGLKV